jgi:hypothetical protein
METENISLLLKMYAQDQVKILWTSVIFLDNFFLQRLSIVDLSTP